MVDHPALISWNYASTILLDQGWLRIEVAGPGQAGYSSLSIDELSYPGTRKHRDLDGCSFLGEISLPFGVPGA